MLETEPQSIRDLVFVSVSIARRQLDRIQSEHFSDANAHVLVAVIAIDHLIYFFGIALGYVSAILDDWYSFVAFFRAQLNIAQ